MRKYAVAIGMVVAVILLVLAYLFRGILPIALHTSNSVRPSDVSESTAGEQQSARIIVQEPSPNTLIQSPLQVTGEAHKSIYAGQQFPIQLLDAAGHVLGESQAHATGAANDTAYVPFTAEITFAATTSQSMALLVLRNVNPSGDPAKDIIVAIPVQLSH
jgi:hypothetical protein